MYKEIVLAWGRGENARWHVRQRIAPDSHLIFSDFHQEEISKGAFRNKDYRYFNRVMRKEWLKGKDIHHDWDNGAICYLFEEEKHNALHINL